MDDLPGATQRSGVGVCPRSFMTLCLVLRSSATAVALLPCVLLSRPAAGHPFVLLKAPWLSVSCGVLLSPDTVLCVSLGPVWDRTQSASQRSRTEPVKTKHLENRGRELFPTANTLLQRTQLFLKSVSSI